MLGLETMVDRLAPGPLCTGYDRGWTSSLQASLLTRGMTWQPSEPPASL